MGSGDPAFNTTLIRWSPASGRREATLYEPGGFSLADAEVTPDGGEVWACNSSFGSPGIRVFSTATGLPVGGAITCTLPPQGISFDDATSQVAGVNDGMARPSFAPPFPNPTRGPVRLAFSPGGAGEADIEILDVAGRRVRTLTRFAAARGAVELTWDLRDDAGRRVPPGVYLADVRSGDRVLSRRVLVLR